MPLAVSAGRASGRGLRGWSIGCWIVLLLAAFGGVQYLRQGDVLYLIGALVVIAVCAGCILRRSWARPAMQGVAVLLALWALATGVLMLVQWGQFSQARAHALAQPQADLLLLLIDQAQRAYLLGLVLKALLLPLLIWLAWMLGRPAVRTEFIAR